MPLRESIHRKCTPDTISQATLTVPAVQGSSAIRRGHTADRRGKRRNRSLTFEKLEDKNLLSADPLWELSDEIAPTTELVSTGVNANDLQGTSVLSIASTIAERGRAGLVTGYRSDPDRWDFEYDTFGDARLVFLGHGTGVEIRSTRTFAPGESFDAKLVYKDDENVVELYIDGVLDASAAATGSLTSGAIVHIGGRGPESGGGNEGNNAIATAALWANVTAAELEEILNPQTEKQESEEGGSGTSESEEEGSYIDRAREVVTAYALHISGSLMENDYGFQEKWLRGENSPHGRPWFILLPKGENEAELRAWGGVDYEVTGTTLGVFPRGYYDDVQTFLNAEELVGVQEEESGATEEESTESVEQEEQNEDGNPPLLSLHADDTVNGKLFTGSAEDVISFGTMPELEKLPLTAEAWVNPTAGADDRVILSIGENRQGAGGISGVEIGIDPQGQIYVTAATDCDWETIRGPGIPDGEWSHVAVTIGADQRVRIYRDGLLVREGKFAGTVLFGVAQSSDTAVGGAWGHTSQEHYVGFTGAMKEVTARSGVVSREEIWANAAREDQRMTVKLSPELTLVSTGSDADTSFDYGGRFEKWLYDLDGNRYFVDYEGYVYKSTSDGIDIAEGMKIGEAAAEETYDKLPGITSSELLRFKNVQPPVGSYSSNEDMEEYMDQLKLIERRMKLVVFDKFTLGADEAERVALERFPTLFSNTDQQAQGEVMATAHDDVKYHNMNIAASGRFLTENPEWLKEHMCDTQALKSNGFRILSTGNLFLDGVTIVILEREAVRHAEYTGKIAAHFASVRSIAVELGVDPNGDGIVKNDLQQFLEDIPAWLREFYEELPAEAQRALRSQYVSSAGKKYWSGEVEYETKMLGQYLAAGVRDEETLAAMRSRMLEVAAAFHGDPVTALAMIGGGVEVAGECNQTCEALLAEIEDDLITAVGTYEVASAKIMIDTMGDIGVDVLQSKVIDAAISLVPSVIEVARSSINGISYLRNRIDDTAAILKSIGEQMVIAAQEMGQDMFELTGESLKAYLERDKNGYLNLINKLKVDALHKAEARNGVDVNNDTALAEYHLSLSRDADSVEHTIFEHSLGDGRHPGKLVMIFLGNFQTIGDEEAGLYQIAKAEAEREGYEVLTFRVGSVLAVANEISALDGFNLHPDVVFAQTENIIKDRMMSRGMFADLQPVQKVGITAYSWGGGTADRLFGDEDAAGEILGNATLNAVAYIDAVSLKNGDAVFKKPAAEHFFNVYQEHTHSYIDIMPGITPVFPSSLPYFDLSQGQPVRGQCIAGAENSLQNYGISLTHVSIDDNLAQLIIDKVLSTL